MTRKDIRKLDQFVREKLRLRGRCEKCSSQRFLQVSHIYSRRYISIRFHPLNMFLLCSGCHLAWHHRPADAVEWAKQLAHLGAGELLITSIDTEGTARGYDVELIKSIAPHVAGFGSI